MIGKKASALDMIFIIIVLMVLGMSIIVAVYVSDSIFPVLNDAFVLDTTNQSTSVLNTAKAGFGMMDNLFLILFVMLNIIPIVFAAFVDTHPVFIVINIVIFILLFLLIPPMSNVMRTFWSQPQFAQYAEGGGGSFTFTIMQRIFQYLPLLSAIFTIVTIIVMFSIRGGSGA